MNRNKPSLQSRRNKYSALASALALSVSVAQGVRADDTPIPPSNKEIREDTLSPQDRASLECANAFPNTNPDGREQTPQEVLAAIPKLADFHRACMLGKGYGKLIK